MPVRYLPDLVRSAAAAGPETAIVDVHGEISYSRMWDRVGQAVRQLRAAGVRPGDRVGLHLPRSAEYVTSLLAVTTIGAVAVPMDPDFPLDRVASTCAATHPRVVLHTGGEPPADAGPVPWLRLDRRRDQGGPPDPGHVWRGRAAADQPALILFTSGSTGRPKGVVLHHAGLVNRLEWGQRTFRFDPTDRVLHKASTTFDASLHEIFAPLLAGATLVIAPPGLQFDSRGLVGLIRETGVTTVHFVPSVLRYVLDEDELRHCTSLRRVFSGGEPLAMELVRRLRGLLDCPLFNLYGPTETSINATTWDFAISHDGAVAPIGWPIDGVTCHVLDADRMPVPPGRTGELWIGGVGVAAGYLDDAPSTAQRFTPRPGAPERLYRSGDLVRLAPAGHLEFLGRIDDQVKVRGVRVEPEGVATVLRRHPQVRDALVVGAPDGVGGVRLVAYVVARGPVPLGRELRRHVADLLPPAMRPAHLVFLEELPRLPNGKVSRHGLPAADRPEPWDSAPDACAAPRDLLRRIWRTALATDEVGDEDDFVSLGGHSLLALEVAAQVRQATGAEVSPGGCLRATGFARWADEVLGATAAGGR